MFDDPSNSLQTCDGIAEELGVLDLEAFSGEAFTKTSKGWATEEYHLYEMNPQILRSSFIVHIKYQTFVYLYHPLSIIDLWFINRGVISK